MARNFTRSRSGSDVSAARSTSRSAKSSQDSSRLRKRSGLPEKALGACDIDFHNPDATVKSCSPSQ